MAIWSRNKIWGASTFNTDVDVADNTNNASVVPATSYLGLKLSPDVDPEGRNRSKWVTSVIGQLLRAVLHIDENRATGANIGVSGTGIESTQTIYTTPEQLPEVDKTTNDFSTPAKSDANGALTTTNDLFNVSTVTTDRKNKKFVIKLSDTGVLFFKARTWLQSEIEVLITTTVNNPSGGGLIPVGVIWDYSGKYDVDPDGFLNLCNEYSGSPRSISNTAGTGTLHDNKYQALFLHLWTNYANTECPVSGGRGVSAAADWAANKDIKLPDYRGRVGGYYKNLDANFGTLGKQIGTETINAIHLPVTAPYGVNNPPHNHGNVVIVNGAGSESLDGDTVGLRASAGSTDNTTTSISLKTNDITGGQVADGGQKHFQPTIIQTAIIKY